MSLRTGFYLYPLELPLHLHCLVLALWSFSLDIYVLKEVGTTLVSPAVKRIICKWSDTYCSRVTMKYTMKKNCPSSVTFAHQFRERERESNNKTLVDMKD